MSSFAEYLDDLRKKSRLREIPSGGNGLIDLVSNDYLGLASRRDEFKEEFFDRFGDAAFSSSASRLLSREQKYHSLLEEKLGCLYEKEVLLFNSGYHANAGVLSALGTRNTLFLSDSLMHASAIDGMMLAKGYGKSTVITFPHNDITALRKILDEKFESFERVVVVTEGIFSMDGDLAPLGELAATKQEFPGLLLYVDEAHSFGVRGKKGLGVGEETGVLKDIDILIGTMGKACGSSGAFVATTDEIRDYLLNRARSFIFSTALAPFNVAWSLLMIEKIEGMEEEREKLKKLSSEFEWMLRNEKGCSPTADPGSVSQIRPYLCGSAEKAVDMAKQLRESGYDVLPIRYPTVAEGTERLRFSLNSTLEIEKLLPIKEIISQYY